MIRGRDIPSVFSAVLSGHIHRFQVLKRDLHGTPLASPVFYSGAIDRISFAERDEVKGYLVFNIEQGIENGTSKLIWNFHQLPTRTMAILKLEPGPIGKKAFATLLSDRLGKLPNDAIVKIKILGRISDEQLTVLRADVLRTIAPSTMNVTANLVDHHSIRFRSN